jgi:hypothetical protein
MAVYTDGTHVVATTIEELHEFAWNHLRFPKKWFQTHPEHKFPHYDTITQWKKQKALAAGAIMVEGKTEIARSKKIIEMFKTGQLQQHYYGT